MAVQGFSIDEFVDNFDFTNISKQSQFIIDIIFPSEVGVEISQSQRKYLVTSSNIPGTSLEVTEINWQGITFPIAATRTFPEWTVTFRTDEAGFLRSAYQKWFDLIHDPLTNERTPPSNYMVTQKVINVKQNGEKGDEIELYYAFPTEIGEITLDHASNDPQTFDVTYRYLYSLYETG